MGGCRWLVVGRLVDGRWLLVVGRDVVFVVPCIATDASFVPEMATATQDNPL